MHFTFLGPIEPLEEPLSLTHSIGQSVSHAYEKSIINNHQFCQARGPGPIPGPRMTQEGSLSNMTPWPKDDPKMT